MLFVTSPRQAASIRCQDLLFPSFGKIEKASRRMDWKPKIKKEKEKDLSKKRMLNEDGCLRKGGNHAISGRVWRAQFSPFIIIVLFLAASSKRTVCVRECLRRLATLTKLFFGP